MSFPYVEPSDEVDPGERIGHIVFGSWVDVLFPPEVALEDISVAKGDSMIAGETVVLEYEPTASGEIDFGAKSDIRSGLEDEGATSRLHSSSSSAH
ncbi:phosphatidylserine decarboxylase [Haloterrigena salifodinae]|uniref:phosphatidylserine decarboxylase n=1 Tax=Haloterrigena salifodinae TaxID=2675099 RepID=UPI000F8657B4